MTCPSAGWHPYARASGMRDGSAAVKVKRTRAAQTLKTCYPAQSPNPSFHAFHAPTPTETAMPAIATGSTASWCLPHLHSHFFTNMPGPHTPTGPLGLSPVPLTECPTLGRSLTPWLTSTNHMNSTHPHPRTPPLCGYPHTLHP